MKAAMTEIFGDFVDGLKFSSLPEEVVRRSRRLLVGYLIVLAAADRRSNLFVNYRSELGVRDGAVGDSLRTENESRLRATDFAMLCGILGHSLELDDGHRWGTAHPAAAVIPAVIAEARDQDADLEMALSALVAGYEVMLRLARAVNPSHRDRGFHTTGTAGAIGAAAAAARMRGLTRSQTGHAMALAALQGSGLQVMLSDQPDTKPLQAGNAARVGVLSARLAERGTRGPKFVFEGELGWLQAFSDERAFAPCEYLDLGSRWETLNVYTKLYPSCRHCHVAIDLLRSAKRELRFASEDIDELLVETYSVALQEVGSGGEPTSAADLMFSLSGTLAIVAETGTFGISHLRSDIWRSDSVRRLWPLIHCRMSAEMDATYPNQRGAKLEVLLSDGRRWQGTAALPVGEPETPVSDADLRQKFYSMHESACFVPWSDSLWEIIVEAKPSLIRYSTVQQMFWREP